MEQKTRSRLTRSFDVGAKGVSGHYDSMLGALNAATPRAMLALAAWAWVLSWPDDAELFRIGPVLSLASVVQLGLAAWTLWVVAPLVIAVGYWVRWRRLEADGLKTIMRNDHRLRLIFYEPADGKMIFDQTTQQQRVAAERTVRHNRRSRLWANTKRLAAGLAIWLAIPIGFGLLPHLTGHGFSLLRRPWPLHRWAEADLANGHLEQARWLSRSDVQAILGPLSVEGVAMWLVFFLMVVPRFSAVAWGIYEGIVQESGAQYIPGAKVIEPMVAEKTLDTMREQEIHGTTMKAPLGEAARRMSE